MEHNKRHFSVSFLQLKHGWAWIVGDDRL